MLKKAKTIKIIVFVTFNLFRKKILIELFRKIHILITFFRDFSRKMNRCISNIKRFFIGFLFILRHFYLYKSNKLGPMN